MEISQFDLILIVYFCIKAKSTGVKDEQRFLNEKLAVVMRAIFVGMREERGAYVESSDAQTVEVQGKKTVDSCVGCDKSYRETASSPIVFPALDNASSNEVAVQANVCLVDVAVGQDIVVPSVEPASLSVDVNQGLSAKEQPAVMESATETGVVSIADKFSAACTAYRDEAFPAVGLEMMPHDEEEEELITVFRSSLHTSPVPSQHLRPRVVSESEPCPVCHQSLSLFEHSMEIC